MILSQQLVLRPFGEHFMIALHLNSFALLQGPAAVETHLHRLINHRELFVFLLALVKGYPLVRSVF